MIQALRERQAAHAAKFTSIAGQDVPLSFGNEAMALPALQAGVALVDRSHWGRVQVAGDDRLRFLHNQSTNDFQSLKPGQGCDTVFVTSTARTIDLVSAYVLEDAVWLLTSPGQNATLMQWMDRFIFFADKVELKDITDTTATFSLVGPASDTLLQTLGAGAIVGQPFGHHLALTIQDVEVRVAVGSGLAIPGYTLLTSAAQAAVLWDTLVAAGSVPLGEQAWEQVRVQQGRPMPGQELTEEVNPLEAGLWYTISLTKGCYIGQETIARLHTYRGVKQQLWGIQLAESVEPGAVVQYEAEKIGTVTSCAQTPQGYFALAYIRTKAVAPHLKVQVGERSGQLVALPFLSHEYL